MNSSPVPPSDSENAGFIPCKVCKQYHDCSKNYKANDNSKKTLLAMVVGIRSSTGEVVADLNDDSLWNKTVGRSKKSDYMPTKTLLLLEMKRRKCILNITAKSTVKDRPSLLKWLVDNPIDDPADISFVTDHVLAFETALRAVRAEEETSPKEKNVNFWRGQEPYLRLIHCILDTAEMRVQFQESYAALSRESIDARNSTEIAPVSFWNQVSDKFKDQDFQPNSLPYGFLHDDFDKELDLSCADIDIDAQKAKTKFIHLQSCVNRVKARWDQSGNGDGNIIDDEEAGSDKHSFLRSEPSACLYLWEYADSLDFLPTVMQQIDASIALTESNIPTAAANSSGTKRKIEIEVSKEDKELMKRLARSTYVMEASVLKSEIRASESTLLDLKGRKIEAMKELRKMRRDDCPAEEIQEQKDWTDQIEEQILAQADALIELEEQLEELRAQEHNEDDGDED
ncbi:hypothetical protein CTEN210_04970 [Chaetoceros tenuissimus]|uniref:Uncharacterized protein n=1 Tax=Chaetoceros tenuissimus TaxID=426638 RepID=A0AAD3CPL4_9STRA|nr:hypothetical protein CTEN210_04970 [Chaetoceros tenuissimus]